MYDPIAIANFFIEKAIDEGVEITPMKVLKLTYIAHGWYMGYNGAPLITSQTEAWKYGPVIPSVYHVFKQYGSNDIPQMKFEEAIQLTQYKSLKQNEPEDDAPELLDAVWNNYKMYTGGELSELTHRRGTPWDETWNKNNGAIFQGAIIPNSLIREYYKQKVQEG